MQIKITQAGWETYTGNLGGVEFLNGSGEATAREAARLANIVQIETAEGKNPSDTQNSVDSRMMTSEEVALKTADRYTAPAAVTSHPAPRYTRAALEKVASEKGITGLREIADQFKVKGTSITKLIEAIVKLSSPGEAAPELLAGPVPGSVTEVTV